MAYSLRRLEKARRLFPGQSPAVFETGEGYDLRSRAKNTTLAIASWIDNDKDDDYLPHQPSRSKRRIPSNRERPRSTRQARSGATDLRPSLEEHTLEDKLSSSSPLTPDDTTGQSKWEELWEPQTKRDPAKAYHFRARKDTAGSPSNTTSDHSINPTFFEQGKSSAKGCLACQELELDCSLVEDPFDYPCDSCRDDECDCIPDPPPVWKRPCEPCKSRRRSRCSYLSGEYDHSQPCFECVQHGFQCVAGPAKCPPSDVYRFEDTDDAGDTDPETEYEDQDDDPADSSPEASDGDKNGKSRLHGSEHTYLAPSEESSQSTASQRSTLKPSDFYCATLAGSGLPPATIPTFGSSSSNPYGTAYRIRTYYPHPLTILDKDSLDLCHWCSNLAYGIVGLGPRDTEILDFGGGRMIEITNGHQREGKEPSRMCWYCATERLQIMQCQHYDIAPMMHDLDPDNPFSVSVAYQDLAQACSALRDPSSPYYGQSFENADHEWCSLCQQPAFWSCNSNQAFLADASGNVYQQMGPVDIGCGLVLCDYCAQTVKRFHGDLDRAVAWGREDPQNKTKFRADVDYILKHSSLN
ncbi:hypothetical protein F1880_001648 [Penicillium rolfsii]|nr:hypothetical protein F1880_001648 [Penicillium rolfsii]